MGLCPDARASPADLVTAALEQWQAAARLGPHPVLTERDAGRTVGGLDASHAISPRVYLKFWYFAYYIFCMRFSLLKYSIKMLTQSLKLLGVPNPGRD